VLILVSKEIAVSFQSCSLVPLFLVCACSSLFPCLLVTVTKILKILKVTSVENTEKCFKTLTSRTKDGEEKWKWKWTGLKWFRIVSSCRLLWKWSYTFGLKKSGEFLNYLSYYQFFRKDFVPWSEWFIKTVSFFSGLNFNYQHILLTVYHLELACYRDGGTR
jgi:hypothetical protein